MEEFQLPQGLEWCRKAKYEVQIELACYPISDEHPLVEGFQEKVFEVEGEQRKFAVKSGFNVLEQNSWTTSPQKPYVITGTVGERWPVKPSNMSAYDVNTKFGAYDGGSNWQAAATPDLMTARMTIGSTNQTRVA